MEVLLLQLSLDVQDLNQLADYVDVVLLVLIKHAYIVQYCMGHRRSIHRIFPPKVQILYELLVTISICVVLIIDIYSCKNPKNILTILL